MTSFLTYLKSLIFDLQRYFTDFILKIPRNQICGPARQSQPQPERGRELLTGEVEVQVEISNPWRYAAIIAARRMTHNTRDTGIDKI